MRRIFAALGLCGLGLAGALAAERPPAASPPESVSSLVAKLGNRDYKIREAAQRALEVRGVETLPELKKTLESTGSAEVRRRLQGMVASLERIQILSPKRLTIKARNQPAATVIAEVSKKTGYTMQLQGQPRGDITLDMTNATFWEVIDSVCNQAGLAMYYSDAQGGMMFQQQDNMWPHVCYQGPFKVVATSFNYNKTMSFGPIQRNPGSNQMRHESLTFAFNVHSESKLPFLTIGQARVVEAVDDLGNSMKPATAPHETNFYHYNHYRTNQSASQINLLWPNKEAKAVRVLRGVIPVTLLGEQKPEVIVDDILKVKAKKFTGPNVEVEVVEVKEPQKGQYHVKMNVRNLAPNATHDYSWTNSIHQRIEFLDAKGNKYHSQGHNWENSSPNHVQATFMFGSNGAATVGPPARLVYNHWSIITHSIDFEFKDLQLP